jgi:DNA-binding protein YbaB
MSNDAARHDLDDVLARVHQQMAALSEVRNKQAAMTATAAVADGTVEVTVDARGTVIKTLVDETYLDDYEFAELGDHVTAAAQAAARDLQQRMAALMVPLNEQRAALPSLSDILPGAPDLRSLFNDLDKPTTNSTAADDGDGWEESTTYPTVRS